MNRKNTKKPICMEKNMHDNINVEIIPAVEVGFTVIVINL